MRLNYEVVRYRPELKAQIIELQTQLWSPSLALNAAYFAWKYERNPYLKEPLIYLAIHAGKVIGMRGFFGVRWECGIPQRQFSSLYADDTVVALEHRRQGVFSKIMISALDDLASRGHDYVFNLSAGDVTLQASLAMGWHSAGWVGPMRREGPDVALWSKVLRRAEKVPLLGGGLRRAGFLAASSLLQQLDLARINECLPANGAMSFADAPRPEAMADLVGRLGSLGKIRHVRDAAYFQWRFENPLSRYRFLYCGEGRLEGYLVLQEYTSAYARDDVVNIVDWEATTPAAKAGLLRAALDLAKDKQMVIWAAALPEAEVTLLQHHGFAPAEPPPLPTPPAILVGAVRRDRADDDWQLANQRLLDLSSWDMRMLYSMHG